MSNVNYCAHTVRRILSESPVHAIAIILLSKGTCLPKGLILQLYAINFWLMVSNNVSYTQV